MCNFFLFFTENKAYSLLKLCSRVIGDKLNDTLVCHYFLGEYEKETFLSMHTTFEQLRSTLIQCLRPRSY